MPGPAPTPAAIRELLGNPGNKSDANNPTPPAKAPRAPAWLTAEAKKEWRRVVPKLAEIKLLTELELAILSTYCEAWSDYVTSSKEIAQHGHTTPGARGPVRSAASLVRKEAVDTMLKMCRELGMTPSARSRITLPGANPKSDLELLLD